MLQRIVRAVLKFLLRFGIKPILGPGVSIATQRRLLGLADLTLLNTKGVQQAPASFGVVAGEWLAPAGAPADAAILYLHGGGYCVGAPASHRSVTSALAAASGFAVCVPDYRLAPEHPCPAALEDALAVYRRLLADGRNRIVVAGDSAGGGLTLSLALALRDADLPRPVALLLLSPWVDLACRAPSITARARRDPMLSPAGLLRWAGSYAGSLPPADIRCSPLHADLSLLPPMLIQVGTEEILYDDSARLHERARASGVASTLRVYEGAWHVFQLHARVLPQSDAAIAELGAFARDQLGRAATGGTPSLAAVA